MPARPQPPRIAPFDLLRAAAVAGVVLLHAALPLLERRDPGWYVLDRSRSLLLDAVALLLDATVIPTLFFVSGRFGWGSLQRAGARAFLSGKLFRLGVPLALGLAFVVPASSYVRHATHVPEPLPYPAFWSEQLSTWRMNHGHLWFLPWLFLLFAGLAVVARAAPGAEAAGDEREPGWAHLAAAAAAVALARFAANLFVADGRWFDSLVLNVQPTRVGVYVVFFSLGVAAARRGWFGSGFAPAPRRWCAVVGLAGAAYLAFAAAFDREACAGTKLAAAALHASFAVSACMLLVHALQAQGHAPGTWTARFARRSYGVYFVHFPIVVGLNFAVREAEWPAEVKFALVGAAALAASFALAETVLARVPLLRRIF